MSRCKTLLFFVCLFFHFFLFIVVGVICVQFFFCLLLEVCFRFALWFWVCLVVVVVVDAFFFNMVVDRRKDFLMLVEGDCSFGLFGWYLLWILGLLWAITEITCKEMWNL